MKRTARRWWASLALACGAASPGAANAASGDSQVWAVAESLQVEARAAGEEAAGLAERQKLLDVLKASDRQLSTSTATHDFATLVGRAWTGRRMAPADLSRMLGPRLQRFFAGQSGEDGIVIGSALWPYLSDAGLCRGDPADDEGARCVFAFGTGNSSIAGSMGDEEIERVDPASVLGSILQQALGTGMSANGIYDDGGGGHGTGEVSYSYLNTLTINAQYGYVYAFQIHCTTSCRASAAGYGSINGRYLATGSDMVFAAVSAALYCDFQCSIGTAYAAYRDRDAVAYALKNGDKRYQPVHGPSKAVHVIADYCGVLPGDYENSPTYIALKDQSPALPYDTGVKFKFGTYAQAPRQADTISALSSSDFLFAANLYPPPTSRDLNVVRDNPGVVGGRQVWFPSWTYDFSTLTSWKFDIIFAAVQNANVEHGSPVYNGAACRTYIQISDYIPGSSAGAHGDQFWIWHGGRTTGDYDLPETKLIFGYAGGRALTAAVD